MKAPNFTDAQKEQLTSAYKAIHEAASSCKGDPFLTFIAAFDYFFQIGHRNGLKKSDFISMIKEAYSVLENKAEDE